MTQNAFNNINKQSYQYQYQDIRYIGEKLIQTSSIQDNSRRNIKLIPPLGVGTDEGGVPIDVYGILGAFENDLNNGTKLVGIFNTGGNHWITYALFMDTGLIKCVYKNSIEGECIDFTKQIAQTFGEGTEVLNIIGSVEQKLEFEPSIGGINTHVSCGIFALKNMLILAQTDVSNLTQNTNNVSFFTPGKDKQTYVNSIKSAREEFGKIFLQYQIEELRNTQIRRLVSDHHISEAKELKKLIHPACTVEIATIPSDPKMYQYKIKLSDDNNLQDIVNRLKGLGITCETTNSNNIILCNPDILSDNIELLSLQNAIDNNKEYIPEDHLDYIKLYHDLVREFNILNTDVKKLELVQKSLNGKYGANLRHFVVLDEVKNKKFNQDIDNLISLHKLITQILSIEYDQTKLLDDCTKISQSLYDINWDEKDKTCIRNKHGYRDRHKDGGNKVRNEGAKLNFETLGHLKDLFKPEKINEINSRFKSLFIFVNKSFILDSLKNINKKIYFILSQEYLRLNEGQKSLIPDICTVSDATEDSKIGFLMYFAAYYHDTRCIDALITYLEECNTQNIDFQNKMHRYHLGYLFTQIGERAKEVSDFIKPETFKTSELNLTRFFFGKLGHYRQEIKNRPHIVYNTSNTQLFQMKLMLDKAIKSGIVDLLQDVQKDLLNSLIITDSIKVIDYGQTIVEINNNYSAMENIQHTSQSLLKFENDNCQKLQSLTVILTNGIESDLGQKIQKYTLQLEILRGKVDVLKKEQQEYGEYSNSEIVVIEQKNAVNKFIEQTSVAKEISIALKQLLNKFTDAKYATLKESLTDKQMKFICSIQKLDSAESKKVIKEGTNLVKIIPIKIEKYEEYIEKAKKHFFQKFKSNNSTQSECRQYQKLKELLKNPDNLNDQLLNFLNNPEGCNTVKNRDTVLRRLESKQGEIKNIEFMIALTKEHAEYLAPFIDYSSNERFADIKSSTQDETTQRNLAKLEHEIEFLKNIEQQNNNLYLLYARKMSIGFIGQYLKILFRDNDALREYVSQDFLLRESINNIINIRSKVVMHGMFRDSDALVISASKKTLLPWQKSFESLKVILLHDKNCKDIILKSFIKIPEWKEGSLKEEQDIHIKCIIMHSYNRLMRYEDTVKVYNTAEVQNYIIDESNSPFLQFFVIGSYLDALSTLGDGDVICQVSVQCIEIIDKLLSLSNEDFLILPVLQETRSAIYGQILLHNKNLAIDVSTNSLIRDLDRLSLADNFLENAKYEDALAIISPILNSFESAICDESNVGIGFNCYKLMSMYYRCQFLYENALSFLEKSHTILKENEQYFILEVGGRVKYEFALYSCTKAAIYNAWGKLLINDNNAEAKEKFIIGQKKAWEAFREYKDAGVSNHPLMLAEVHRVLAENYSFFGKIQSQDFSEIVNRQLAQIESYLTKISNPNKLMQVCEIRINMAEICLVMNDQDRYHKYLLLAHKNEHWKFCADFYNTPKTFEIITLPDPSTLSSLEITQILSALDPRIHLSLEQRQDILKKITIEVDIQGLAMILSDQDIVVNPQIFSESKKNSVEELIGIYEDGNMMNLVAENNTNSPDRIAMIQNDHIVTHSIDNPITPEGRGEDEESKENVVGTLDNAMGYSVMNNNMSHNSVEQPQLDTEKSIDLVGKDWW